LAIQRGSRKLYCSKYSGGCRMCCWTK